MKALSIIAHILAAIFLTWLIIILTTTFFPGLTLSQFIGTVVTWIGFMACVGVSGDYFYEKYDTWDKESQEIKNQARRKKELEFRLREREELRQRGQ